MFVLDHSVAMRWLLQSEKAIDQKYAESVLRSFNDIDVVVPGLRHLEVVNVLMSAERRGEIEAGEVEGFVSQLENLPLRIDLATAQQAFSRTLSLARIYKLSSYDAAYLELSVRERLPLATLD
ncbi:MAG: hypothetical protein JWM78_31 [Verrucomicrobiaceae bacterium]|nr:hypothetical protein [Verrucomicrobiaceae bacterium]